MTTKEKLLAGALETLRERGIAGASARAIAGAAGVNQALVFHHFGSVHGLLTAACEHGAREQVGAYRERFDRVRSLTGLLELGRRIRADERADLAMLAQLLAGSQVSPELAPATATGLALWTTEIEAVLTRVLASTPLAEFVDVGGLARAVTAAFVGLDLYEGVDREGADRAVASLEQLGHLLTALEDLGPVARLAIRGRLRRKTR
ncbi:TetR/AcrR family transcriptional regulator [Actinocorallia longicatena]|uniref:TetR family transcriptional regulator n=1 Tax=Actinocorallia longicatena TaxID=111803 RepID=A0ABP6QRJ5_9ACTN